MGRSVINGHGLQVVPRQCNPDTQQQSPAGQLVQNDQRIVYLAGDVSELSISIVTAQMLSLASVSADPITLIVSTYGGSIDEMFVLYDTIKFLNCPVHTVGLGKVMSAGVLLLASGERGKRLVGPSTRIMIHGITHAAWGNVFDIMNQAQESMRLQHCLRDALLKETNIGKDRLDTIFKSKADTYFSAIESVKLGIADKIIGSK